MEILLGIGIIVILVAACCSKSDYQDGGRPLKPADLRIGSGLRQITDSDFQRVSILDPDEWSDYHRLRKYAADNNMVVCPKMGLSNLLRTVPQAPDQELLKSFLNDERVDFAICTPDLQVLLIVQLSNNSRAEFALKNAGYKCATFDSIDDSTISSIKRILRSK